MGYYNKYYVKIEEVVLFSTPTPLNTEAPNLEGRNKVLREMSVVW